MPSNYKRKSHEFESKKVYICCEDGVRAPKYFRDFIDYFKISESDVLIIKQPKSYSAPQYVFQAIDEYKQNLEDEGNLFETDEFWLVMDVDLWGEQLDKVIKKCSYEENYFPAISNPCFEMWLLTHHFTSKEIIEQSNDLQSKKDVVELLTTRTRIGSNKKVFLQLTDIAIKTSRQLDTDKRREWPEPIGTRIYILVETLLKLER